MTTTNSPIAQNTTSPAQARWPRDERRRLALWLLLASAPPLAIGLAFHLIGNRSDAVMSVRNDLPFRAAGAFFAALATWVVARKERRPLDAYGFPLRLAFGIRFWEGAIWGVAMLSAVLTILQASGHFHIDAVALAGKAAFRAALGWGLVFLGVSFTEELTFRGYLLFVASRRMRFWPAAFLLSILFGAAHLGNHGENVLGILQVVGIGLLFCLMIRRTGNLWFAIGFHAAWDWAETFFYGTPDSGLLASGYFLNTSFTGPAWLTGGVAGPEGSIYGLAILLVCAALVHLRFPKAIYPDRPA